MPSPFDYANRRPQYGIQQPMPWQRPAGGFPQAQPQGQQWQPQTPGQIANANSPNPSGVLPGGGMNNDQWKQQADLLWSTYGPQKAMELMQMMQTFQGQQNAPYMQQYQQALGQYGQALPQYQQQMGQTAADYQKQMQQMMGQYQGAMQGAYQPAAQAMQRAAGTEYGAGMTALGQGQNQINQQLASGLARSGMAGTGVGQARAALGSAAGAFAMPQLQNQYANRQNEMAQFGYGHGTNLAQNMAGMRGDVANTLYGHGTGVAGTGLNFAGNMLGAQGGLLQTQLGQTQQAQQAALQNLYQRMGMMPQVWDVTHQQELWDEQRKNQWKQMLPFGGNVAGGALMGLGA